MRLTSEVVVEAEQGLNCLGDRELILRNLGIVVIENLALAKDSFDIIDMTGNSISSVGDGFPPFPRLSTLYLGCNRISRVESGIAASLPNLETLILTSNEIESADQMNLPELGKLKRLEVLSLLDNPIMHKVPNLRRLIIQHIPSLKVFNFTKVTAAERAAHQPLTDKLQKVAKQKDHAASGDKMKNKSNFKDQQQPSGTGRSNKRKRTDGDESADNNKHSSIEESKRKSTKLSADLSNDVQKFIRGAKSIDDVTRIQHALQNGTVEQVLASFQTGRS